MKIFYIILALLISSTSLIFAQEDDCTNLGSPVLIDCTTGTVNETGNGAAGSGADSEVNGACLDDEVSWYSFEFDPAILTYNWNVDSGDCILFEGSDCGNLSEISCVSLTDEPVIPGTTYWVALTDGSEFTFTTATAPTNDDCADAESMSENDSATGSNVCASAASTCGGLSVWYEVTVTTSGTTLEVTENGGGISNPQIAIFDGCGGNQLDDGSCTDVASATCLAAGTYLVEVGSASGDEGTIDISTSATTPAPTGDICDDALEIGTGPVLNCGDNPSPAGDASACPDAEATGCMVDVEGMWYTFTTAATLGDFDIDGDYELFEGNDCSSLSQIANCGPSNITADATTTYWVLVGPGGADIMTPVTPNGPDCNNAIDASSQNIETTCCSVTSEVWFEYDVGGATGSTEIIVNNISISSGFVAELFSGTCTNSIQTLTSSGSFDEVSNCDSPFFLRVESDPDGCGEVEFGQQEVGCMPSGGEDCNSAITIAQPTSNTGSATCVTGCNNICPPDGQGCGNFTQWFEVFTDIDASAMDITVTGFDGQITIDQNECGSNLLGCTGFSDGDVTSTAVSANISYFIGVQSDAPGEFEICVETYQIQAQCSDGEITASRPETGGPEEGPFCAGEKVDFTYSVTFTADPIGTGNNCQWIQGIIPTLGAGWDLVDCPIEGQGPGGGWEWETEGTVTHKVNSPVLFTQAGPHGLELAAGGGGLGIGDALPGGWWFTSQGNGANCTGATDPNTTWGLPQACGSDVTVTFQFSLRVNEDFDPADCMDPEYLKVHMFTMADGQTGCWSNNACAADLPAVENYAIDCQGIVETEISGERNICPGAFSDLLVEAADGSATIFVEIDEDSPTDTGYTDDFDGDGTISESVDTDCEIALVIYAAYTLTENGCKGPVDTFHVRYLPEVEFEYEQDQVICPGGSTQVELNATCSLGPYVYEWADGSTNSFIDLPLVTDLIPGPKTINVTVTDAFGCPIVEVVEYTLQENPLLMIDGSLDLCQNGTPSIASICSVTSNANVNPNDFDFQWTFVPPTLVIDGPDDNPCLLIDEEASAPGIYNLTLAAEDNDGCVFDTIVQLTISGGPTLSLQIAECQGDSIKLVGYNTNPNVSAALYITQYDPVTSTLMVGDTLGGPIIADSICVWTTNFTDPLQLNTSGGCNIPPVSLMLTPTSPPDITQSNTDICAGESFTLTLNNPGSFPGGVSWNDGTSTQSGSSITSTPAVTTTYTFTGLNALDCEVTRSFTVNVNPNPEAEITGSTTFCAGESTDLTATGNSGTMPFMYLWSDNSTNATLNVTAAGNYSVTITDASGCEAMAAADVSVAQSLTPSISAPIFCAGTMTTVDGGSGFDSWDWVGPNGEIESGQTFDTDVEGEWTLTVAAGSCTGTGTITVTAVPELPIAIDSPTIMVCNEDTGTLPTNINLNDLVMGGVTGIWTDDNGNNVADASDVAFDNAPTGVVIYTFTTTSAQAPCMNTSYMLEIDIQNCGCPSTSVSAPNDFCNDNLMPYDLAINTSTTEAGTWSITPADVVINGTVLEFDDTTPANAYELIYTLDATVDPNCSQASNPVSFTVFEAPFAELNDSEACDSDASGGSTIVDLDDLVMSGNTDGIWSSNDFLFGADNVVDFAGATPGTYTFSYNVLAEPNSACSPFSDQVSILVADCACPILGLTDIDNLCNTGGNITLGDFLNDTADPGAWTIDMGTISAPDFFDAGGVASGTYEVTYSLFNPVAGCDNSISGTFEVFDGPTADLITDVSLCNGVDVTTFPTRLDLTSLVQSGSTGIWIADPDYVAAKGAITDETDVDFTDVPPGIYNFTYTTNTAVDPCVDVDFSVRLDVRACNCPTAIFDAPPVFCTNIMTLDLNQFITNLGDLPSGDWSFGGVGPVPAVVSSTGEVQTSNLISGTYSFWYNYLASEVPPSCPPFASIEIEFEAAPEVTLASPTACNRANADGTHCIDLTSLVMGAPGEPTPVGTWATPANYTGDDSDISMICFDGLDIGASFEFIFTVDNSAIQCDDFPLPASITVIDCDCPTVVVTDPPNLCNNDDLLQLTDLQNVNNAAGSWTITDPNGGDIPLSLGTYFDPIGNEAGVYTLTFTLNDTPPTGCPEFAETTVTLFVPAIAGQDSNTDLCVSESEVIDLADILEAEDPGGVWTETSVTPSTGTAFDAGSGTFNTEGQRDGEFTFEYTQMPVASSPCDETSATVTVTLSPLPVADAGSGGMISCESTVDLGGTATSTGANFSYSWSSEPDVFGADVPTTATITIGDVATYTLMVTDNSTGCTNTSQVEVLSDGSGIALNTEVTPAPCADDFGSVLFEVTGGDNNYTYTLNGEDVTEQVGDLTPGTYAIEVSDGNGCMTQATFVIDAPLPLDLELGDPRNIDFGGTEIITINTTMDPATIANIQWIDSEGTILCDGDFNDCSSLEVDPDVFETYTVIITDINGCTIMDDILVREQLVRDVYIPTIFNPKATTPNNIFRPLYDEFIEGTSSFQVFDRWGELVFNADVDQLNSDPNYGWNGTWNNDGGDVEQGVYVYYIEIRYLDNGLGLPQEEIFVGDVTIIR